MKYTPKEVDESVNYGKPISIMGVLSSLALICLALIIVINIISWGINLAIPHLSIETEKKFFSKNSSKSNSQIKALNPFLEKIIEDNPELKEFINIEIYCSKEKNAFALPGGKILITSALISSLSSENALATVLAHEVGHIKNRDHLRGLGVKLVTQIVFSLVGLTELPSFLNGILFINQTSYSRQMEDEADKFAKKSILKMYGHLNGANEFFEMILKEKGETPLPFLSTHPALKSRSLLFQQTNSGNTPIPLTNKEELLKGCQENSPVSTPSES